MRKQRVDVDPRRSADRMSAACQQASPLPGPSIDRCTTQPLRLCGLLCVFGSTTSNHAVRQCGTKYTMWLMDAEQQNFEAEEAKLNFKRAVEEVLGVFDIGLIS